MPAPHPSLRNPPDPLNPGLPGADAAAPQAGPARDLAHTGPASLLRRRMLAGAVLSPWLVACGGGGDDDDGIGAPSTEHDRGELAEGFGEEATASGPFDASLVHQLATGRDTPHRLFRGNVPITSGSFDYGALVSTLRAKAVTPLPDRFELVVVSLLNDIADKRNLDIERAFFSANPGLGRLVHHPIYGALTDPHSYPAPIRRRAEKLPGLDRMASLLTQVQTVLDTPVASDGLPQMVYVHCQAGRDRTGQVSASYRLRYQAMSYLDALAESQAVAGRPVVRYSRYGLKWWAYDLADHHGITTIGRID